MAIDVFAVGALGTSSVEAVTELGTTALQVIGTLEARAAPKAGHLVSSPGHADTRL